MTSQTVDLPSPTRTRLAYVDRLRVALTILVVAHHCALTYSSIPLWYFSEPGKDPSAGLLDGFVAINQLYFMGLFFLLSGVFVPRSYDKKGSRVFSRDRVLRLAVPLIFFVIVLRPLALLPSLIQERSDAIADGRDFSVVQAYLTQGDPGPMWFVEVLLLFSLCYVGFRLLTRNRTARTEPLPFRSFYLLILVGVMFVLTTLWRLLVPNGTYWPIVGLPTPAYLPQYSLLFVAGILAGRHGWLNDLKGRHGWIGLAMAVVALAVGMPLSLSFGLDSLSSGLSAGSLVLAATEAVFATGMIMGLLVLFRRFFNRTPGALSTFASDHAFTVYIIHPVVLVGIAALIGGISGLAVAKFALLFVIAVPVCWGVAFLIRRIPGAQRVL